MALSITSLLPDYKDNGSREESQAASSLRRGGTIKKPTSLKGHRLFLIWLPRLVDFRNWLMTSGEVEILKILTKGLPFV